MTDTREPDTAPASVVDALVAALKRFLPNDGSPCECPSYRQLDAKGDAYLLHTCGGCRLCQARKALAAAEEWARGGEIENE